MTPNTVTSTPRASEPAKTSETKSSDSKKTQSVTLSINIGTDDQSRYRLPSGAEGDTIKVDEETAQTIIKKGWAKAK